MTTLPPLKTTETEASREERAAAILSIAADDVDVMSLVFKGLLDLHDPKKVVGLMKVGFDTKISEMMEAHTRLQSELAGKVSDGTMQQSEMLIRIKNSDGKIRSMQWFLSNIT